MSESIREIIRDTLQDRLNRANVDHGTLGALGADRNLCRVIAQDITSHFPTLILPFDADDVTQHSTIDTLVNAVRARLDSGAAFQGADENGRTGEPSEVAAVLAPVAGGIRDTIRAILRDRLNRQNVDSGSIGTLGGDENVARMIERDIARAFPNLSPPLQVRVSHTLNALVNEVRGRNS